MAKANFLVWGDDFEAILDMLEDDEGIEEHFTTAVNIVSKLC